MFIKLQKDPKRLRTQEELVARSTGANGSHGDDCDSVCGTLQRSSEERLVGGVIFEDERHYRFVYEDGLLHYEEEKL